MNREGLQDATRNLRDQIIQAAQAAARNNDEPEAPWDDRDQMDAIVARAKESMASIERSVEAALWARDDNEATLVTGLLESAYTLVQTARQIAGNRIARDQAIIDRDKAQADYEAAEEQESDAQDALDDAKMDLEKATKTREESWDILQRARRMVSEAKEAFGK